MHKTNQNLKAFNAMQRLSGWDSSLLYSDRFSQVPGTVHIAASLHGEMVGKELHGDHSEDSLQGVDSLGDLQGVLGPLGSLGVALLHDDDGLPISSSHLNNIVK